MAREAGLVDGFLTGAVGAVAAAVVGTRALRYYHERTEPTGEARMICMNCGESYVVDDVLDPTVTCSCGEVSGSDDITYG